MGIDDMMGLVRLVEEEAVGLGAAGVEKLKSSSPVEEGSVPERITRRMKGEE